MKRINFVIKNAFFTILFILVLFTPPIRFLPYYTWILALLGMCTLKNNEFVKLIGFWGRSNFGFLKYLTFVLIFNSLVVPLSHFSGDFTYIPLQIGIILSLFRNILLVYCLHKYGERGIFAQYIKYFFIACCIYVTFTLSFIVSPEFKSFWLDAVLSDVKDMSVDFMVYQFRYSLDGFAAFSSASVFSFACLFCSYKIAMSPKVRIIDILCLMMMVIGCFFYGRVSLIGMVMGAFLIIWASGSMSKALRIGGIIIVFVMILLSVLNFYSQTNDDLLVWQEWAFSIIKQLFIEKEVTDYSVTHMVDDMYYMPDLTTFLFGDGLYTNKDNSYYGHTDVGFMRLILYGGIISLTFVYVIMVKLTRIIIRASKSIVIKRFALLALSMFIVLEMKGESYQRAIMMLYPIYLLLNYQNNINVKAK